MRFAKLTLVMVIVIGTLVGLRAETRASGSGTPSCVVTSLSALAGRATITGSGVVELTNVSFSGLGTADRADATLTLSYRNMTTVFRAHVPFISFFSAEDAMCQILDANPTAPTGQTIFQVFGLPTPPGMPTDHLKLCLVIEPTSQTVTCQSIQDLDFHPIPGTTSDWTGATKLVVYFL